PPARKPRGRESRSSKRCGFPWRRPIARAGLCHRRARSRMGRGTAASFHRPRRTSWSGAPLRSECAASFCCPFLELEGSATLLQREAVGPVELDFDLRGSECEPCGAQGLGFELALAGSLEVKLTIFRRDFEFDRYLLRAIRTGVGNKHGRI